MSYQTPLYITNAQSMPEISHPSQGFCRFPTLYGESIRSLMDDFEAEVMDFEEGRPIDSMMIHEIDEDLEYYENYTLPEEQLYGYEDETDSEITEPDEIHIIGYEDSDEEDDIQLHPNITVRTSEDDIQLHPNITVRNNRTQQVVISEDVDDIQLHPNITVRIQRN